MTDLRFALRLFARQPWFTLLAVLPLALGIGVNASILGLVDALLLRPMPGISGERLAWIQSSGVDGQRVFPAVAYADLEDLRSAGDAFEEVTAFRDLPLNMGLGQDAERLQGELVSANYFSTLGVHVALGRGFLPEEDWHEGSHPVAVIAHDLWQRRFNRDPGIIGRHLVLNAIDFTIVGVAPPGFAGTQVADHPPLVWLPITMHASVLSSDAGFLRERDYRLFQAVGRLRPGVGMDQAQAALSRVAKRLAGEPGGDPRLGFTVLAMRGMTAPSDRGDVESLGAVAFAISMIVLVIACANVGGLLLGRAGVRGREIGIRLALGAGRGRLVRQLLTESLLLALVAGCAGLLLATWTTSALVRAAGVPFPLDVQPTPAVLGGTLLVTLLASLLFGTMPALHASRPSIAGTLESPGAGTSRRRSRLQHLFAVAQVALSLALLATAGLLVRSVQAASTEARADTFPERVLTASVDLSSQGYSAERQWQFAQELLRRVRGLPGVESASLGSHVPGRGSLYTTVFVPGVTSAGQRPPLVRTEAVWPGYFSTLGIRLLTGRDFSPADGSQSGRVAIVNEAFVARYWRGGQGLGRQFHMGDATGIVATIVGVVREAPREAESEPVPAMYLARPQQAASRTPIAIFALASGRAEALAPTLRQVVSQLDPSVPLYDVATLRQVYDLHLLPRKAASSALDIFGGLALFLAAIGVYGLAAWTVSRRQREIGVRLALGASRGRVLRMVMRDAGRIAVQGCLAGLALALAATRMIAGMMTGAAVGDVVMYSAVTAIVACIVLLASYVPAHRATRVDPAVVLRVE